MDNSQSLPVTSIRKYQRPIFQIHRRLITSALVSEPPPGPQVGHLWARFGLGIPVPMLHRNASPRETLEPGLPATLSGFQIHRFLDYPLIQPGAAWLAVFGSALSSASSSLNPVSSISITLSRESGRRCTGLAMDGRAETAIRE
jgi:hypothetical protein